MKRDLFSSLISNGLVAVVMFICLPIVYRTFGTFTFSLFSYYLIIFGWVSVLDFGITPILSRSYVKLKNTEINSFYIKTVQTFNTLPYIIAVIMVVTGAPILLFILKATDQYNESSGMIYGIIVAMAIIRYLTISIKGGITGLGGFDSIAIVSVIAVLLRFSVPWILISNADPLEFFLYQLIVNIAELTSLNIILFFLKKRYCDIPLFGISVDVLKSNIGKLLSVGIPALIWAFANQYDRTIFAAKLDNSNFSEIMLLLSLSSAIGTFVSPLSGVMTQKITEKITLNNECGKYILNLLSCYFAIIVTISCPLIFLGGNVFYIWTGYELPNVEFKNFLMFYAIAGAIAVLNGFAYVLQASIGQFRYHLYSNLAYTLFLLPLVPISFDLNGYLGVAESLAFLNICFFCGYFLLYLRGLKSSLLKNLKIRNSFFAGLIILIYFFWISTTFSIANVSRINVGFLISIICLIPIVITFHTLKKV